MEVDEGTVNSVSTDNLSNNLYDENRKLGNSLYESVGVLEKKRIILITKRNRLHSKLNWHFQEISGLRSELERLENCLDKSKTDCARELLKRDELERKSLVNEGAFSTQLMFQNAISKKIDESSEEINSLTLKDKQVVSAVEEYWDTFQSTVDQNKNDITTLKSKITESKQSIENEKRSIQESIASTSMAVTKLVSELKQLIEQCINIKQNLDGLPFESYKNSITEDSMKAMKLQNEIHSLKTEFVIKIEEIKRKNDKMEFEVTQLTELSNDASGENDKLNLEIQKISSENDETNQLKEKLTEECAEIVSNLAQMENKEKKKIEEKELLKGEVEKLMAIESENESLQLEIDSMSQLIDNEYEAYNGKLNESDELKQKEYNLTSELVKVNEETKILAEENLNLEQCVDSIEKEINDLIEHNKQSEQFKLDEVNGLKSLIETGNEEIDALCKKFHSLTDFASRHNVELEELKFLNNTKSEEAYILENQLQELEDVLNTTNKTNSTTIQEQVAELNELNSENDSSLLLINGELSSVQEEYDRLEAAKIDMIQSMVVEKEALLTSYNITLKAIRDENMKVESTYQESFNIAERKAETIAEEIKKQTLKNEKMETRCNEFEERIKRQDMSKKELQNRIVVRENKLSKARNAAVITRKELMDCDTKSED